jgi:hypothetical protein
MITYSNWRQPMWLCGGPGSLCGTFSSLEVFVGGDLSGPDTGAGVLPYEP